MCNVLVNVCSNKFECNRILAGALGMCIFEKGRRCKIDAWSFFCFIFVFGLALGRAGHVLVGRISGKENGAVSFIWRTWASLPPCPLSQSFWTIRTWNSPEESTGRGHQLERWNSSRISKEDKDFFQSITSYNHRSMLFHNRNQIVNLYWCIF